MIPKHKTKSSQISPAPSIEQRRSSQTVEQPVANMKKALAMSKLSIMKGQTEAARFTQFRSQMQFGRQLTQEGASTGKPLQKSRKGKKKQQSNVESEVDSRSTNTRPHERKKAQLNYSQSQNNFMQAVRAVGKTGALAKSSTVVHDSEPQPLAPVQRASETMKVPKAITHGRHVIPKFRNIPNNKKEPQSAKNRKDHSMTGSMVANDQSGAHHQKPKFTPMESPAEKKSIAKTLKRYFGDQATNSSAVSAAEKLKRATMKTHRMVNLGQGQSRTAKVSEASGTGNTPGAFDEHPQQKSKLGKVKLFNAFPQALINKPSKATSMIDPVSRAAADATVSKIDSGHRQRGKKPLPAQIIDSSRNSAEKGSFSSHMLPETRHLKVDLAVPNPLPVSAQAPKHSEPERSPRPSDEIAIPPRNDMPLSRVQGVTMNSEVRPRKRQPKEAPLLEKQDAQQVILTAEESPSMIFDDEQPIEETHSNAVPQASDREKLLMDSGPAMFEESQATVDVKMDSGRPVPNIHSSFKHALLNSRQDGSIIGTRGPKPGKRRFKQVQHTGQAARVPDTARMIGTDSFPNFQHKRPQQPALLISDSDMHIESQAELQDKKVGRNMSKKKSLRMVKSQNAVASDAERDELQRQDSKDFASEMNDRPLNPLEEHMGKTQLPEYDNGNMLVNRSPMISRADDQLFRKPRMSVKSFSKQLVTQLQDETEAGGLHTDRGAQERPRILDTLGFSEAQVLRLRMANLRSISPGFVAERPQPLLVIDLRNNRLMSLPEMICAQTQLKELKVDYNFLDSLPYSMQRMRSLNLLSASQNALKSLPQGLFDLRDNLAHLILNDNKLSSMPSRLGNLVKLETLYLQNNPIKTVASSVYRLRSLSSFGLDWLQYLQDVATADASGPLKILKASEPRHAAALEKIQRLCMLVQVQTFKRYLEDAQAEQHKNPQQDDEPRGKLQISFGQAASNTLIKGVTVKHRRERRAEFLDPLCGNAAVAVGFPLFMLYFYGVPSVDVLVMRALQKEKQRKLSHLIAIYGHAHLMKAMIRQLDSVGNSRSAAQTTHQFLNAVDHEFSTPLILALRNQRNGVVRLLAEQPRVCLRQLSTKYGTALHIALANQEMRIAGILLRKLTRSSDFQGVMDLNRVDADGNTALHLVMRGFDQDEASAKKLCKTLLQHGVDIACRNRQGNTALHAGLQNGQLAGVQFALKHNQAQRKRESRGVAGLVRQPMFDFNDNSGRFGFTALHFAIYQNNFRLLHALLSSDETLNHEVEDQEGRTPVQLCNSISSIYKTLRRELAKHRGRRLRANDAKMQEPHFQPYHQQILTGLKLSHTFINAKDAKKKSFRPEGANSGGMAPKYATNLSEPTPEDSVRDLSHTREAFKKSSMIAMPKPQPAPAVKDYGPKSVKIDLQTRQRRDRKYSVEQMLQERSLQPTNRTQLFGQHLKAVGGAFARKGSVDQRLKPLQTQPPSPKDKPNAIPQYKSIRQIEADAGRSMLARKGTAFIPNQSGAGTIVLPFNQVSAAASRRGVRNASESMGTQLLQGIRSSNFDKYEISNGMRGRSKRLSDFGGISNLQHGQHVIQKGDLAEEVASIDDTFDESSARTPDSLNDGRLEDLDGEGIHGRNAVDDQENLDSGSSVGSDGVQIQHKRSSLQRRGLISPTFHQRKFSPGRKKQPVHRPTEAQEFDNVQEVTDYLKTVYAIGDAEMDLMDNIRIGLSGRPVAAAAAGPERVDPAAATEIYDIELSADEGGIPACDFRTGGQDPGLLASVLEKGANKREESPIREVDLLGDLVVVDEAGVPMLPGDLAVPPSTLRPSQAQTVEKAKDAKNRVDLHAAKQRAFPSTSLRSSYNFREDAVLEEEKGISALHSSMLQGTSYHIKRDSRQVNLGASSGDESNIVTEAGVDMPKTFGRKRQSYLQHQQNTVAPSIAPVNQSQKLSLQKCLVSGGDDPQSRLESFSNDTSRMDDDAQSSPQVWASSASFIMDQRQIDPESEKYFTNVRRLTGILRFLSTVDESYTIQMSLRLEMRMLVDKVSPDASMLRRSDACLYQFHKLLGHCIKYMQRLILRPKYAGLVKMFACDLVNIAQEISDELSRAELRNLKQGNFDSMVPLSILPTDENKAPPSRKPQLMMANRHKKKATTRNTVHAMTEQYKMPGSGIRTMPSSRLGHKSRNSPDVKTVV